MTLEGEPNDHYDNRIASRRTTQEERTRPSTRVVEALAEAAGVDSVDLPPLYDAVDPDALDSLFAPRPDGSPRVGCRVSFRFDGYQVTVHRDGEVQVRDGSE